MLILPRCSPAPPIRATCWSSASPTWSVFFLVGLLFLPEILKINPVLLSVVSAGGETFFIIVPAAFQRPAGAGECLLFRRRRSGLRNLMSAEKPNFNFVIFLSVWGIFLFVANKNAAAILKTDEQGSQARVWFGKLLLLPNRKLKIHCLGNWTAPVSRF